MELGTRIKFLRTQRRMSQEALAQALDVSRQAVAKWEGNHSLPSTANLLALCQALGVSMQELTGPDGPETPAVPKAPGIHRARLPLLAASLALMALSLLAGWAYRAHALPDSVIGYADAATGLFVTGAPLALYGLYGLTLLALLATLYAFFKPGWRGKKRDRP